MVTRVQGGMALDADFVLESEVGVANGVAELDGSGKVPPAQLPAGATGALSYQGTWNANTNSPALASGVGTQGHYYVVGTAGATNLDGVTDWQVGDWAVYNGTAWEKADHTDVISSVFGRSGVIVGAVSDYDASQVDNDSGVAGAQVSDALDTLDSGKSATGHGHTLADVSDSGALAALNTVGAAQIDDEAVTLAKMAHIATARILGRSTAAAGDVEVLAKAAVLALLNVADGANAYVHSNHTGDVTSTGDGATVITEAGLANKAINMQDKQLTRAAIKDYSIVATTPSISAGTLTLNLTTANAFNVTWGANITTLTVSNWGPLHCSFLLRLAMDGTTRTVAWPAAWKWPEGTEPTDPAINEDIQVKVWTFDGGTTIYAAEIGQAFA